MNSSPNSRFIADHIKGIPRSGIRDFFAIVSEMQDAISLGIGEPDFVTPWPIREAAIFALEKGKTSYTDNRGLLSLRKEISKYVSRHFAVDYAPTNQVLVSVGVSEALDIALRAIINPGDKILYHEPCYVSYHPSITMAHGVGIGISTEPSNGFALTCEQLTNAWEPGCKVLILNFPTNPTGGYIGKSELEKIAKFCIEKDILVISDEIYAELTFEKEHVSIASLPGMVERTIFIHGFSKAYAMTGFRIGYACGPVDIIEAMMKIHQYCMMCAPILSQEAAIEAFKNGWSSALEMKSQYQRRRDFVVKRFNEMGLPCHLPEATFYAFPQIPDFGMDEKTFATKLLQEAKVALVPGNAFGPSGKGHLRASFATSYEQLIEAMKRIEAWVRKQG